LFDQHVALASEHADSTDLRVQLLDDVTRTCNQTGSRVGNGGTLGADRTGTLQAKRVQLEAPVGLGGEGRVDKVTGVVRLIDATEHHLATVRIVAALTVEPEREYGLTHQTLGQQVVPHGGDVIDRDGVEGETQHTVELAEQERDTRFAVDLSIERERENQQLKSDVCEGGGGDALTSANTWFLMFTPAMLMLSCDKKPCTPPLPYRMLNAVPFLT
jgi:hypothetical protein